jgi:hypothetical protein
MSERRHCQVNARSLPALLYQIDTTRLLPLTAGLLVLGAWLTCYYWRHGAETASTDYLVAQVLRMVQSAGRRRLPTRLGKKELPEKGRSARIGAHFLKEICAREFIFDIALKQTEIPGGPAEIAEIPVRRGQRATARPW